MKKSVQALIILMTVGGGFLAVALSLDSLVHPRSVTSVILTVVSTLLFCFITAAGIRFALDPNRSDWIVMAFALQVPYISLPHFTYKLSAAARGDVFVTGGSGTLGVSFDTNILSSLWELGFGSSPEKVQFGLNVLALIALLSVVKYRSENKQPIPLRDSEAAAV